MKYPYNHPIHSEFIEKEPKYKSANPTNSIQIKAKYTKYFNLCK